MPSRRIINPLYRSGFPFIPGNGQVWDGTFSQHGTANFFVPGPSEESLGSYEEFPFYTPDPNKVGAGTLYPIGMSRDSLAKITWRVKSWNCRQINNDPAEPEEGDEPVDPIIDYILYQGLGTDGPPEDSPEKTETDIQFSYTLDTGINFSPSNGVQVFFRMFVGGYQEYRSEISVNTLVELGYRFDGVTNSTIDYHNSGTALKVGNSYYPLLIFGNTPEGIDSESAVSTSFKGGNNVPSSAATISFDESTTTFIGESTNYSFRMSPRSYWTYGGFYNEETGVPN